MSDEQPPIEPPFFTPPAGDPVPGSPAPELHQTQETQGSATRPLTPAPSLSRSHEAPAPMVVVQGSKAPVAYALLIGLIIGGMLISGMWFYQKRNTYTYTVSHNSSVLAKPRDVQEVLAHVEPATVAVSIGGGVKNGGSAGTGFVYSSDGVIVTNNHVVDNASSGIQITFNSGRSLPATLLGRDPLNDLAVLKVDAKDLPVATIGSSEKMKVGDDVIAIGNALALEGGLSVTRGIVSGLNRTIDTEVQTELQGVIQTDAAINRGNSGGPLVNSQGQVIGINTAIADPTYAQNIGFAIAIDRAKPIIEDLRQGRDHKLAFLGIGAQDVNERVARELNLKVNEGALVVEIQSGSPAAKSDLSLDDVIVKIDNADVKSANDMVAAIRSHKPGDKVTLTFNRAGKELTTKVSLVDSPL